LVLTVPQREKKPNIFQKTTENETVFTVAVSAAGKAGEMRRSKKEEEMTTKKHRNICVLKR
jgi:hypothetical protein